MEDCFTVRVQQPRTLSPKVLYVRVTTHVRFASFGIGVKTAVVGQVRWRNARQRLVDERGHLEVDALAHW